MCGIVGYISKNSKEYTPEKNHFMRFALALDTLRGADSTGIMTLRGRFNVNVHKTTMPGDRYVHSAQYRKNYRVGWAQVGHNRASTVGKSTLKNAHPFEDGPITLVHNGTLWGAGKGLPKYNTDLEVDSAQIAHNLAEHSVEEAKGVIEEIDGSFCLVWFDARDKSINMCRNDDRPMAFTVNQAKSIMWFMSDPAHLYAVNRSLQGRSAHGTAIYKLEKNKILKWMKGSLVPEVTEFDPFSYAARQRRIAAMNKGQKNTGGSSDSTALDRATARWQEQLEKNRRGTTTQEDGFMAPRVKLGGMLRRVPEPMLAALEKEYELTPKDLLQFTPDGSVPFADKNMVWGEVNRVDWGNTQWRAVLMDANTLQINTYMNRDWLVQPIGIAHPWDKNTTCPSILCRLIHCNWDAYDKRRQELEKEAEDEGKVVTPTESADTESSWIVGPERELTPYKKLRPALERGCVSCGGNLTVGELDECIWVNNRVDILCKACIDDFHQAAPYGTPTNTQWN